MQSSINFAKKAQITERKTERTAICLLLLLALLASGIRGHGLAAADSSIRLEFKPNGSAVEGVRFDLFRVAEREGQDYALVGDFAEYPVRVDGLDSEAWGKLANTLAGYVQSDSIVPLQTVYTGADGRAAFSALADGLYLVIGQTYAEGTQVFAPQPVLVVLPGMDADSSVNISVKSDISDRELIDLTVLKIWKDSDYDGRPAQTEVQLLGNGTVYETVILSKDNNWQHVWADLDPDIDWKIVEVAVPDGYTVQVDRNGMVVSIINSRPADDEPDDPTLPQTGLMWWPVPPLAGAGMLLFVIGWIRRRQNAK